MYVETCVEKVTNSLVFGVQLKSSNSKDKSGTGAVNAFEIYYTYSKYNPYKLTNLVPVN